MSEVSLREKIKKILVDEDKCFTNNEGVYYFGKQADLILSLIRTELEGKMPKESIFRGATDTYYIGKYDGWNECLAEIRTIIQGIK